MEKKIEAVKQEYGKLKEELGHPDNIADRQKIKKLSQRFSQLKPIIEKITELEKMKRQYAQAQSALTDEQDSDLLTIATEELISIEQLKGQLTQEIAEALAPRDPMDHKNIIMEIRAGAGGNEAGLFAAELFRMYSRYAERRGWTTKILSTNRTNIGGFKEVIFEVSGNNAYKNLKYESGTHRVQRVPETEKSGRVHTSTATVAVLPEAEDIDIEIKPEDLRIDVFRSGGHGGQSVNTTDSAVRITHLPSGMVVSCQDEKSQQQNKTKAMQILRARLLAAEQERIRQERGEERKSQIGSGDRSEKIRTYNFPQDRLTDHRIKENFSLVEQILSGELQQIIDMIAKAVQQQ